MRFILYTHKYTPHTHVYLHDTNSFVLLIAVRNQRVNRVRTYIIIIIMYSTSVARSVVADHQIRLVGI